MAVLGCLSNITTLSGNCKVSIICCLIPVTVLRSEPNYNVKKCSQFINIYETFSDKYNLSICGGTIIQVRLSKSGYTIMII